MDKKVIADSKGVAMQAKDIESMPGVITMCARGKMDPNDAYAALKLICSRFDEGCKREPRYKDLEYIRQWYALTDDLARRFQECYPFIFSNITVRVERDDHEGLNELRKLRGWALHAMRIKDAQEKDSKIMTDHSKQYLLNTALRLHVRDKTELASSEDVTVMDVSEMLQEGIDKRAISKEIMDSIDVEMLDRSANVNQW